MLFVLGFSGKDFWILRQKLNGLEILCFFKRGVLNWLVIVFSSVRTEKEEHFRMGLVILFIRFFLPEMDGCGYGLLSKPAEWYYRVSFAERVE